MSIVISPSSAICGGCEHLADQLGVERARDLVEQHHLGAHGQRAGDGDALLLAARELRRVGVELVAQPHLLEQLLARSSASGASCPSTWMGPR
jgi:hypothetical protein